MSKSKISQALEELRHEIDRIEVGAEEDKERLLSLLDTIEDHQESSDDEMEPTHELLTELNDVVTEFEVAHPRVTGILNDILVVLGSSGI